MEIGEFGDPARDRRFYEMRYSTLRDGDGMRIGAYQFVYDVTERVRDQERLRKAEEALRQSQKLESIGQLTGGVAHDFNNLLAVFSNGLQLLERNVTGGAAGARLRSHAPCRGAGNRIDAPAAGVHAPPGRSIPESIDLAAHLKGMREMLERSLGGDIHVEMDFGADLWPVEIDAGEFELAMLNLFANARDAMPGGGTITIDARNLKEAATRCGRPTSSSFPSRTRAAGCRPRSWQRVFEPFFTTKEVGKGSGLGLPQVYGFAQQSGGRLTVESQVRRAPIVTLLLPRSLRQPAARAVDASSAAALSAASGSGVKCCSSKTTWKSRRSRARC